MSTMTVVSFFDADRSGKVRWLAHELGLELTEERITFQQTKEPGYLAESPFAVVPLLRTDGRTLRETTAIGHHLIETHGPHLGVRVGARVWVCVRLDGQGERFADFSVEHAPCAQVAAAEPPELF